jgi:asparagine synthetase B (glutamine-hydrolysing)
MAAIGHRGSDDARRFDAASSVSRRSSANGKRYEWRGTSFNGEIYNFRELRHQLEAKIIAFCSAVAATTNRESVAAAGLSP